MSTISRALALKPSSPLGHPIANTAVVSAAAFSTGLGEGHAVGTSGTPSKHAVLVPLVMVGAFHGVGMFVKDRNYSATAKAVGDGLAGSIMAGLGRKFGEKLAAKK